MPAHFADRHPKSAIILDLAGLTLALLFVMLLSGCTISRVLGPQIARCELRNSTLSIAIYSANQDQAASKTIPVDVLRAARAAVNSPTASQDNAD